MTSPAQLKYLDAIGIPVWVSRDRVMQLPELQPQDAKKESSTDSDCIGSVDDILQDLDKTKIENTVVPPLSENKLMSPSVKTAGEAFPEPSGKANTNKLRPSNLNSNEIGRTNHHTVYACGNLNADWLIVGESPETSEELQNQPFTTDSGVLLSNMLKSIGLQKPREDAYLINVLKQASSENDLEESKLKLNRLLHETIVAIKPKMILIVGQICAQNLLQSSEPLVRLRSKPHTLPDSEFAVVVTYYPSYLLSKPIDKRKAWDDLKLALTCFKTN